MAPFSVFNMAPPSSVFNCPPRSHTVPQQSRERERERENDEKTDKERIELTQKRKKRGKKQKNNDFTNNESLFAHCFAGMRKDKVENTLNMENTGNPQSQKTKESQVLYSPEKTNKQTFQSKGRLALFERCNSCFYLFRTKRKNLIIKNQTNCFFSFFFRCCYSFVFQMYHEKSFGCSKTWS